MISTLELMSLKTVPSDYSWDLGTPGVEFNNFVTDIKQLTASSTNGSGIEYVGYAPFFSVKLSSIPGTPSVSSVAVKRIVDFGDYYNAESNTVMTVTLSYEPFCHNYIMPGLYSITFIESEYISYQVFNSSVLGCLDKYCIDWSWKSTADCETGGPLLTWANTAPFEDYEKLWKFEGCDAPWASKGGLYIQPSDTVEEYPLSWQWYNFLCNGGTNEKNKPVTWSESGFQNTNELSWSSTSGPCLNINNTTTAGIIWVWDQISCNLVANPLANNITWDETNCDAPINQTWNNASQQCKQTTTTISISSSTIQTIKKALFRVLEIPPTAYLQATDQPVNPEDRFSPLTVRLTPRYVKCGSFPIEKIVWDLGDGSPLLTQRRWANNIEEPFSYNNVFNLDYVDPRNYDVIHTYRKTSTSQFMFYPSITAYSSSTGKTDCASFTIGPLRLSNANSVAMNINLLQSELTLSGSVILADVDNSVAVWRT
tara:strand:+ start:4543 stop:5991 length:1449 start_codon:yes stop_codon:yes gene_type:complete